MGNFIKNQRSQLHQDNFQEIYESIFYCKDFKSYKAQITAHKITSPLLLKLINSLFSLAKTIHPFHQNFALQKRPKIKPNYSKIQH